MERFRVERLGELRATAQDLANLYSGAVASSVWEFDKENTRSQLEALKVVDGFQRAVIWETNGPEFVAVSNRIADGPHVEGKAKIFVNGKEIAWILVRLSRKVVAERRRAPSAARSSTPSPPWRSPCSPACSRRCIS